MDTGFRQILVDIMITPARLCVFLMALRRRQSPEWQSGMRSRLLMLHLGMIPSPFQSDSILQLNSRYRKVVGLRGD